MDKKTACIIVIMLVLCLLAGVAGIMQYSQKISNTATLKLVGIAVFKDVNLTIPVTTIDWGMLEPGQTKNCTVYMRSTSNVPLTLSMYVANWNPANASAFLHLAWDYKGQVVAPSASIPATFSLAVNASISGISIFSFDIWIVGSG